jgi:DNA polymerase/3'-5' exonuclease PolX
MRNQDIAKILHQIAELLEMQSVAFKPGAYENTARTVESLSEDI